ncbi:MAG: hypothetical protein IPK94_09150 [Saprospiraceae bacterium]|nr:hypothetical protein [Saprospiraceae bacterium]
MSFTENKWISVIVFLFMGKLNAQVTGGFNFNWSILSTLPPAAGEKDQPGVAGPVSGIAGKHLIVAGGANFPDGMPWTGGKKVYRDDYFVMKKKNKSYTWISQKTSRLQNKIAYSACITTPKGIVSIGGENEYGLSKEVFLLRWDVKDRTLLQDPLPGIPVPTTNGCATRKGNLIYFAGGETRDAVSNQFMALDLLHQDQGWQLLPPLPHASSHAALIYQSQKIYLIGGRKKTNSGISELYEEVYEYNAAQAAWTIRSSLPYALSAGSAIAFGSDQILLFGGDQGTTFHQVELALAAIQQTTDESLKKELIIKKNHLLSTHPGFDRSILFYDTRSNIWTQAGIMPYETPVTTPVYKWGRSIILPCGEIKAGIRSPRIIAMKPVPIS